MTLTPNYLYIENNLTKDDLNQIKQLINSGKQVDGIDSVMGDKNSKLHELKNNTEIILDYDSSVLLNRIIYERMDTHAEFLDFTVAKTSSCPILSRMVPGNYYKPHQDSHITGDFSTTYFLNDPETYEGGELCLWIDNKEQRFKPPAGSSVTYKTGIPHRVNTVTKGVRDVAVSWAHSQIKDPFDMQLFYALRLLQAKLPNTLPETLDIAIADPKFIVDNLIEMILRKQNGT